MIDDIKEILDVIKKNKLRTFLTGFSVAWGIFILTVLLGVGNGLKEGVKESFKDLLQNQYFVSAGLTSISHAGFSAGRKIELKIDDYDLLLKHYPEIYLNTPIMYHDDLVSYKKQYSKQILNAIYPDFSTMNNVKIINGEGRFINQIDINEKRKSIVIGSRHKEIFFKQEYPIGKYLKIGKTLFQVVGVYEDNNQSVKAPMYVSFSTIQSLYKKDGVDLFIFTLKGGDTKEGNERFISNYRKLMGGKHHFDPADLSALYIRNTSGDFYKINTILTSLSLFFWFIGLSTLLSGIVGINNIVMISIRERTKEFAIRKTIGAKPISIIVSVLTESTLITVVFGFLGLSLSTIVLKIISWALLDSGLQSKQGLLSMFSSPSIDLQITISSTVLFVIIGVSAGFFPARKAVSVNIIKAINKI